VEHTLERQGPKREQADAKGGKNFRTFFERLMRLGCAIGFLVPFVIFFEVIIPDINKKLKIK
jgi:hypothetical protein